MLFCFILMMLQLSAPRWSADSLIVHQWTIDDGLPLNSINAIIQGNDGYIWLTTSDGLVRFNGHDFYVYNQINTPEFINNRFTHIYEQPGTGMWVAHETGGILLYKNGGFYHFGPEEGFTNNIISSLFESRDGRFYAATDNGLFRYNGGGFEMVFDRKDERKNRVVYAYPDDDNSIWAATFDGLVQVTDSTINEFYVDDQTHQNAFLNVAKDPSSRMVASTRSGIYYLDSNELKILPGTESLYNFSNSFFFPDSNNLIIGSNAGTFLIGSDGVISKASGAGMNLVNYLSHAYKDSRGNFWLVSKQGEIFTLENNNIKPLPALLGVSAASVNYLVEDQSGTIWIGSRNGGLFRLSFSEFNIIGEPEGLHGNNTIAIFEDSRNRNWISLRDIGVNMIDGKSVTHFGIPILNSALVQTIAEDPEGNIWVGHHNYGLNRISSDGRVTDFQLGFEAGINDIYSIFFDSIGQMWLGTRDGLLKFNRFDGSYQEFKGDSKSGIGTVRYIIEDGTNSLWLASATNGVIRFRNQEIIETFDTGNAMPTNIIRSLYADRDSSATIFVGTETSGLIRIRDGKVSTVSSLPVLIDHNIHFIDEDDDGYLWFTSNKGLMRARKSELNRYFDGDIPNLQIISYTRRDGLRNAEFNGGMQNSGFRSKDGSYWFSGQGGVVVVYPKPTSGYKKPVTVTIDRIQTPGGDTMLTDVESRGDVTIHFSGINPSAPHHVWYRYKMKNVNENWIEWTQKRSVSYFSLKPGSYTFEVQAAGLDGIWQLNSAKVSVKVPRLFYQSIWFYLLLIGFAAGTTYGISQLRIKSLETLRQRLSRLVDDRTKDLQMEKAEVERQKKVIEVQAHELDLVNKTKDRFFSIIGHDLRGPFQTLLGLTEIMIDDYDEMTDEEIKRNIQSLRNASQNLHRLVENLLEWSSLQSGKIRAEIEPMEMQKAVINLLHIYEPFARHKKLELEIDVRDEMIVLADRNMIDTILRNLVSNAIKFTNPGGSIRVRSGRDTKGWWIEIADTGIGMKQEMIQNLMKIDKSTKRRGTSDETGTGLGLVICRELVQMMSGNIEIVSEEGRGTMFTIRFPRETVLENEG